MENPTYRAQVTEVLEAMRRAPADPWRPAYHLTPLAGTLGDPNGLCQWGDTYHIFYVTSPLACRTTERTPCVWGHVTTRDFVQYRCQPVAIWPDDRRDRDGAYSGSALLRDGKLYLYYTGNVRHHGDFDYIHAGREQNVLRVESTDGVHFTNKTVLLTNADFPTWVTQHIRDPQMWEQDGKIYMLLGARTQTDEGCALVWESEDGTHFRHVNTLHTPEPFGYMWECPDYAVVDGQPLFIACPQGIPHETYRYANAHQCGCFPLAGTPTERTELGAFQPFDYGFDYYAARTLKGSDGRVLLFGWMGMSETDYGRNPCADRGWDQVIAMPRELHWKDGALCQTPLREMQSLRGEHRTADGAAGFTAHSRQCELQLTVQPGTDLTVHLFEDAVLYYAAAEGVLTLTAGAVCGAKRTERKMRLPELRALDLYLDASTLEVFVNDGQAVLTSRLFGSDNTLTVEPFAGRVDWYAMQSFGWEYAGSLT